MELMFLIHHDGKVLDVLPLAKTQTLIDSPILVRGGKVSITDGPFAETKEQLGACGVASRLPSARAGITKGRRVRELTGS